MWWKLAIWAWLIFASCARNDGHSDTLTSLDSNAAIKPSAKVLEDIVLQTFMKTPRTIEGCMGIFVRSEDSLKMEPYVFVSNLKGIAFIKTNERLMEVRLVRQSNIDRSTVNELYANEELEVELRIKQSQLHGEEAWDYKGVLIIRKKAKREAIPIQGRLKC